MGVNYTSVHVCMCVCVNTWTDPQLINEVWMCEYCVI